MKKTLLILLCTLVLFSDVLWGAAQKPPEKLAPPFPKQGVWLNSGPLDKTYFQGHTTLVYFWDYTSLNCLRDITFVKKWYEAYSSHGLQILFIHAPEFGFAKDQGNIAKALKRYKIPFPVFLDNNFELWNAYKIYAWPTKVLVGPDGSLGLSQAGEGEYRVTESAIRTLLVTQKAGETLPEPILGEEPPSYDPEVCGPMTSETYIGYKRANWWGGEVANRNWTRQDETMIFKDRGDRVQRGFFLHGLWKNKEDHFEHDRETRELTDYLGLLYFGSEVYAVMGKESAEKEGRIYVTRDEAPLMPDFRGKDIQVDESGRTYVEMDEPRLYHLVENGDEQQHEIKVWSKNQGVFVSSFSFSNYCLSQIDIV